MDLLVVAVVRKGLRRESMTKPVARASSLTPSRGVGQSLLHDLTALAALAELSTADGNQGTRSTLLYHMVQYVAGEDGGPMNTAARPDAACATPPKRQQVGDVGVMRVAVIGLGMGAHLARWCASLSMDVRALCDRDATRIDILRDEFPTAYFTTWWQDLLDREIDGVIVATDFGTHASMAMEFLNAGVHVLSETAACSTVEEGRALIDVADRSIASYSFAENYVVHPHVRTIEGAVEAGEVGRVQLVEADYLHAMAPADIDALIRDPSQWRGRIAPTAYCTHTVSPALRIADAWPVEVTAFAVDAADPRPAVVLVLRLSSGALAITRHGFLQGEPESHWSWVSVRCSEGSIESVRAHGDDAWSVRVRKEGWATTELRTREERRVPTSLVRDGAIVNRGDESTILTLEAFRASVIDGAPPMISVRPAVAASLVGLAGAHSLNTNSMPVEVNLPFDPRSGPRPTAHRSRTQLPGSSCS